MARFDRESGTMHRRGSNGFAALVLAIGICAAANAFAQKKPPSKPVDLNAATLAQLEQVPGIGPSRAQAIVNFREKSGPDRKSVV